MATDLLPTVEGDDSFVSGMNSFSMASKLAPGEYVLAMNVINRGGLLQTRPGSSPLSLVLASGDVNVQGITMFQPTNGGAPALVWMIDGLVFYSYAPFTTEAAIPGLQFGANSRFVAWAQCLQTTYIDEFGEIKFLDEPKDILVIQDGNTRAGYWDGAVGAHLDPTSPALETPVGLWMKWSNNRLWVSRGNLVFASDAGNPLKFTEAQYLNEGRAFYLPGDCTGMAETPERDGIICFTRESGTLLKSYIQDRDLWLQTPDFQKIILPGIGCVSPRSITQQYGTLWWNSSRGLINLDDALRLYISSQLNPKDNEMFQSKYAMSFDVDGIAGMAIENFLLQAIPISSDRNTRIHVMDQSPLGDEGPTNVWPSYWTGWRPVEFAKGSFHGGEYLFTISYDYDGITRIWQLFTQDKTDGGIPITSFVATKQHFFGNRDYKKFKYAEIELQALSGATAFAVGAAGMKGGFQKVMEKDINAINGQVYWDTEYGAGGEVIAGTKLQSRIVRTIDFPEPSECNGECVESTERGLIDKAFSLLIAWSGIGGISAYRIFAQSDPKTFQGICENQETGEERLVTTGGCGVIGLFSTLTPFETYYSQATYTYTVEAGALNPPFNNPPFNTFTITSIQSSVISQVDADRKALARSKFYVDQLIAQNSP